jgi:hypothetical protein
MVSLSGSVLLINFIVRSFSKAWLKSDGIEW